MRIDGDLLDERGRDNKIVAKHVVVNPLWTSRPLVPEEHYNFSKINYDSMVPAMFVTASETFWL